MATPALLRLLTLLVLALGPTTAAVAQSPEPTGEVAATPAAEAGTSEESIVQTAQTLTRASAIAQAQADKVKILQPYVPSKAEEIVTRIERAFAGGGLHPFFHSAYSGGGFTLGAGYARHVSPYNVLDVRGSYTVSGYKRAEAEFIAPRVFQRRGSLSLLGGWREATQVGFYGIGMSTSKDDRTNYLFQQPYASGLLTIFPTRQNLVLRAGLEWSRWSQSSGQGSHPSVETAYTPDALSGLGARATYLHSQATVGWDWRTSPGYTRRGGFYGVTFHDYADSDDQFGFQQVDYEAIQHFPILREAWVLSLRGLAQTSYLKDDQEIPFFMLPSIGGGSSMRGFSSWRFRDRNSLLLQAEWRIMVNRFLDTAVFYDMGKVTSRTSDFDLDGLKSDYGFGVRFHGPLATPLRVELAKSNEGLAFVFSSSSSF